MPRQMKDSGIAWIGEIPEGWTTVTLGRIANIQTGNTPAKDGQDRYYSDEAGVPWIKAEDLGTNNSIEETSEYLTSDGIGCARLFAPNTVFVCCIASVGKVGFSLLPCSCNQQINGITFGPKYYWKYGFYVSKAQEEEYLLNASGNVMKIINSDKQSRLVCPLPLLSEQKRIADFLDAKCVYIDSVIEKTKASIEEYKKLKQAIITEAVTKGVRGERPMKDSGIEWIGEIPDDWNKVFAFQIFEPVKNKNTGLIENNLLSLSYGKLKRKSIDTVGGLLPESFEGYNIIEKDDIVLRLTDLQNDHKSLRVGLATERGIITSAYLSLRIRNNVNASYLYYYLHSFDIAKGFYGMGAGVRQGLNWEELKHLQITLPSENEQQEIVSILNARTQKLDIIIANKNTFIEEMESYKKSLIYEYVTGKKEVPAS